MAEKREQEILSIKIYDDEEDMEIGDPNGNDLFDTITSEQIDHSVYIDHMYLASEQEKDKTPEGATCPVTNVNAAKNILEIASNVKKQRKIEGSGEVEDNIDDLRTADQERRDLHVEDAIINIQNHQAHLLDTSVIQSHSEWFQYLPNSEDMGRSRFNCHFCSRYRKEFFIMEKSEFDDKEGVLKATKRENHQAIKNHAKSAGHQKTMDIYERRMAAGIFEDVDNAIRSREYPDYEKTNNAFRGVLLLNKKGRPFTDFKDLLNFGSHIGGTIGPGCKSPMTGTAMTLTYDKVQRRTNAEKLQESKSPFSLILGKNIIFHFFSMMIYMSY